MYEIESTTENTADPTLEEENAPRTEETSLATPPASREPATEEMQPETAGAAPAADSTAPTPPADEAPSSTVPLARLQGVQRALSQAERERDHLKSALAAIQQELAQAHARAASEYVERIKSTQRDIVPDLIRGETIEQVDAALSASRAAFAAARQAYARTIPTPSAVPSAVGNPSDSLTQPGAQPPSTSAVQLISQGLRQPASDINK